MAKEDRIIAWELWRQGWKWEDLPARRQSDPEKVAIAARWSGETILSLPRFAVRLHLGSANSAKAKLNSWRKAPTQKSSHPLAEAGKIGRKL